MIDRGRATMSVHMEEIMKIFVLWISLVLGVGLFFATTKASAFQSGEVVFVSKYCPTVEATKAFLFEGGNCIEARKPFACVFVKVMEVYRGWNNSSCSPLGRFPVVYSYARAAKGISL